MSDQVPIPLLVLFSTLSIAAPLHFISCWSLRFLLRANKVATRELFAESRLIGGEDSSYSLLRGRYLLPWTSVGVVLSDDGVARYALPVARISGMVAAVALAAMLPVFLIVATMGTQA